MTIYKRIVKDRMTRRLTTDQRGLYALIQSEICVDGKPMDDDKAVIRLTQMAKTCIKNITLYKSVENVEKVVEEQIFCGMIDEYLPQGATQEDIETVLSILNLPRTMKSMGPLMKKLKSSFQVVDGNLVKSILKGE